MEINWGKTMWGLFSQHLAELLHFRRYSAASCQRCPLPVLAFRLTQSDSISVTYWSLYVCAVEEKKRKASVSLLTERECGWGDLPLVSVSVSDKSREGITGEG